jgi:hypothetical protein
MKAKRAKWKQTERNESKASEMKAKRAKWKQSDLLTNRQTVFVLCFVFTFNLKFQLI